MKQQLSLIALSLCAIMLTGCAHTPPQPIVPITTSIQAPGATQQQIYARAGAWIAVNSDVYHFSLQLS